MKYWQIILVFLLGSALGIFGIDLSEISFNGYTLLDFTLILLIILIGIDLGSSKIKLDKTLLKDVIILVSSTVLGGVLAGLLGVFIIHSSYAIPIALGSGWYSYTAARIFKISSYWGAVGLITNMLREILCMLLYPIVPKPLKTAFITFGGATTMDTTLPVIRISADEKTVVIAFIHGFLITLLVPILLEIALNLI